MVQVNANATILMNGLMLISSNAENVILIVRDVADQEMMNA